MSELFCVHAEHGLRIENNGACRACCMQYRTWGDEYNVKDLSFEEIKKSPDRLAVLESFKKGEKHPNCNRCWEEEAAGYQSKRQRDNEKFLNESIYGQEYVFPAIIDVSMGNACNIKCRTCGAFNSSFWAKEFKDLGHFEGTDNEYKEWLKQFNDAFDDNSEFWQSFKENLGNVKHIDFYGGEPFLVKKQWEMLEYAIEKDYAKDIVIHYNTNGTIWDQNKASLLKEFRNVYIDFSIDGIGDHLHYIRYPAEWNVVYQNLLNALEFSKIHTSIKINVCVTISVLNVYYISEIDAFFKKITDSVYLNLVHDPSYFNIKNLPQSIKEKINEKLESYSRQDYYTDKVLKFMNNQITSDNKKFNEFCEMTIKTDKYRNQSFKSTFPEMYNIIKEAGYKI